MTKEQKLINSIDLFYSYAHEDEVLRNELDKHLSLLRREGLIKDWHDREIGAGTEWEREINIHLKTAQVILLLVSADFLASEYCYGIEMERAIERHEAGEARVIPIILRPADLKSAPFSKLQPLPTNGIPITEWSNRDRAFVNVTEGIRKAVEDLSKKSSFGLLSPRPDISQARHINGNDPEGPTAQPNIHPSPTKASKGTGTIADLGRQVKLVSFVGRREEQKVFRETLQKLMGFHFGNPSQGEGIFKRVFLLYGDGGMGKTELLKRFAEISHEEGGDNLTLIRIDWDEYQSEPINSSIDIMDSIYKQISNDFDEEMQPYRAACEERESVQIKASQVRDELPSHVLTFTDQLSVPTSGFIGKAEIETATQSVTRKLVDLADQINEQIRGKLSSHEYDVYMRPQLELSKAFVQGLKNIAEQKPIILMFDTYEHLDRYNAWIRDGLIHKGSDRIIYVISGRNDHTAFYSHRFQEELLYSIKLREFSRLDIEDYLQTRNITASPSVVESVFKVSRGVPLAVKAIAKVLKERKDFQEIFGDLAQTPLRGMEEIVGEVTRRFLRYCMETKEDALDVRHSKSLDRSRIYALALMRQHSDRLHRERLLKIVWGDAEKGITEQQIDTLLQDLAFRYSFILGPSADMHPTVRKFIKMALRDQSIPRGTTTEINNLAYSFATTKMQAITGDPVDLYRRKDYQEYCLDCLNHLLWIDPREAMLFLAKHTVKALSANRKFSDELLKIVKDEETYEYLSDEHKRIIWALESVATWSGGTPEQFSAAEEVRALLFEWLDREEKITLHLRNAGNVLRMGRRGVQRALEELKEAEKLCLGSDEMGRIRAETYVKVAETLYNIGRIQEAISLLKRSIELESSNAYAYALLGRVLFRSGDIEKALEAYETASSMDISDAYIDKELQQLRALIAKLEKGESLDRIAGPDKVARALTISGNILANEGLLEKASEKYRMALAADSSYVQANVKLGHVLRQLGQFDEAERQFQLAEMTSSSAIRRLSAGAPSLGGSLSHYINALAFDGLAALKRQMGNLSESISLYEKAISINRHYSNAYNGLGKVYCLQGHVEEAKNLFRQALEYKPDAYWVFNNLGIAFLLMKQENEAISSFETAVNNCQKAIRKGSRVYLSYFNLSLALVGKGEYTEGLLAFQKAYSICTASGFLSEVVSDVELIERGRPDEKMREVVSYIKELCFSTKQ